MKTIRMITALALIASCAIPASAETARHYRPNSANWNPSADGRTMFVNGPSWTLTARGARRLSHAVYSLAPGESFCRMVIVDRLTFLYLPNRPSLSTVYTHTHGHPNQTHAYNLTPAVQGDKPHLWTYTATLTYRDRWGEEHTITASWTYPFILTA